MGTDTVYSGKTETKQFSVKTATSKEYQQSVDTVSFDFLFDSMKDLSAVDSIQKTYLYLIKLGYLVLGETAVFYLIIIHFLKESANTTGVIILLCLLQFIIYLLFIYYIHITISKEKEIQKSIEQGSIFKRKMIAQLIQGKLEIDMMRLRILDSQNKVKGGQKEGSPNK